MWPRRMPPLNKYHPCPRSFGCSGPQRQLACIFRKLAGIFEDSNARSRIATTRWRRPNGPGSPKATVSRVVLDARCKGLPIRRTPDPSFSPNTGGDGDAVARRCPLRGCRLARCRTLGLPASLLPLSFCLQKQHRKKLSQFEFLQDELSFELSSCPLFDFGGKCD